MKIGKPHDVKTFAEYNNNDVVSLFYRVYEIRFGKAYPTHFRPIDIQKVKGAMAEHGLFAVIASLYKAMDRNDDGMNIPFWIASIESLLVKEERVILELYCYMRQKDDQNITALWRKYTLTRAKWFPSAASRAAGEEYLAQLKEALGVTHA